MFRRVWYRHVLVGLARVVFYRTVCWEGRLNQWEPGSHVCLVGDLSLASREPAVSGRRLFLPEIGVDSQSDLVV